MGHPQLIHNLSGKASIFLPLSTLLAMSFIDTLYPVELISF